MGSPILSHNSLQLHQSTTSDQRFPSVSTINPQGLSDGEWIEILGIGVDFECAEWYSWRKLYGDSKWLMNMKCTSSLF